MQPIILISWKCVLSIGYERVYKLVVTSGGYKIYFLICQLVWASGVGTRHRSHPDLVGGLPVGGLR